MVQNHQTHHTGNETGLQTMDKTHMAAVTPKTVPVWLETIKKIKNDNKKD